MFWQADYVVYEHNLQIYNLLCVYMLLYIFYLQETCLVYFKTMWSEF